MKKFLKYFNEKPKTLFLIDGVGALMTALSLIVIVREFIEYFGMSKNEVNYLSLLAFCFCMYSAICYMFLKSNFLPFIRFVGIANSSYCALIIGLMIRYKSSITVIGIIYFLVEIIIICCLSYVELKVANGNRQNV
jgi:hypothetical protein